MGDKSPRGKNKDKKQAAKKKAAKKSKKASEAAAPVISVEKGKPKLKG